MPFLVLSLMISNTLRNESKYIIEMVNDHKLKQVTYENTP